MLRHFRSPDTVFLLAFAVMMLNTDLHNKNVRADKKMKVEDFVRNLRGTAVSFRFSTLCRMRVKIIHCVPKKTCDHVFDDKLK